jgi:hypothetical protein
MHTLTIKMYAFTIDKGVDSMKCPSCGYNTLKEGSIINYCWCGYRELKVDSVSPKSAKREKGSQKSAEVKIRM